MTVLRDSRVVKNLALPESGITVKIMDGLLARDLEAIEMEKSDFRKMIAMVTRIIVEWDAENDNGEKLPIDINTVGLLGFKDIKFIQDSLSFLKDFLVPTPN